MRALLSNNDGYKVWVEINEPTDHCSKYALKFSTQWEDAKNPDGNQDKFQTLLTQAELENFIQVLRQGS